MPVVMIVYYILSAFIAAMLIWDFVVEKKDKQKLALTLIVLLPFVLRLLRIN